MGYISFSKGGGEVDLLPAENIIHVTSSGTTNCEIVYAIPGGASADKLVDAVVVISAAEASAKSIRNAVNAAIEKANGASGPAIPVGLVNSITSITPGLTS
jgi:hypothetical protein|tara:strand:+ start:357 stop:659 length:303 start_codon:yes stop_codon:yes gene_type:complete